MADRKENEMTKVTSIPDDSFIRMLDVDGNSVQINKASFMEAVRSALPEATAEKKGMMSCDVFNTGLFNRIATTKDFDKIFDNGIFFVSNNYINYPSGSAVYGVLLIYGYGNTYTVQQYHDTNGQTFRRAYCNSGWRTWEKI